MFRYLNKFPYTWIELDYAGIFFPKRRNNKCACSSFNYNTWNMVKSPSIVWRILIFSFTIIVVLIRRGRYALPIDVDFRVWTSYILFRLHFLYLNCIASQFISSQNLRLYHSVSGKINNSYLNFNLFSTYRFSFLQTNSIQKSCLFVNLAFMIACYDYEPTIFGCLFYELTLVCCMTFIWPWIICLSLMFWTFDFCTYVIPAGGLYPVAFN